MSEMFIKVISKIAKSIVAHENDMLLHAITMVSVKVQVRIGNKILKTIKVSSIRSSNKSKSGTYNKTCLQSKDE
jgi:hypothetical protein